MRTSTIDGTASTILALVAIAPRIADSAVRFGGGCLGAGSPMHTPDVICTEHGLYESPVNIRG